jgi:type IV pilus assembly protein PilB
MALKIGELLLKHNLITQEQLEEALELQKQNGGKVGANLVQLGYVKEDDITNLLSQQYGIPSVDLAQFEDIDANLLKLIPAEVAQKYMVFPVNRTGANLVLAMADPTNVFAMDDIKFMTGYNIEPVVASEAAIRDAIDRHYGTTTDLELKEIMDEAASAGALEGADTDIETVEEEEGVDIHTLEAQAEEAPVVRLVNLLITDAIKKEASDIHIETYEKEFRIRFRIDGVLYEVMKPPYKLKDAVVSRVKIMSKMDISEKRLPQDGRIKLKMSIDGRAREMDFRVSCLPCLFGEKIVMRLLDREGLQLDMTKLGLEQVSLDRFKKAIYQPYGMVLVTGPTGSGKTNTLYSAMADLNKTDVNIITAEDPVEFNIAGINQVQMKRPRRSR